MDSGFLYQTPKPTTLHDKAYITFRADGLLVERLSKGV